MKKLKGYWLNYFNVGDIYTLKIGYLFKNGYWQKHDESDWLIKSINDCEIICSKVGFKLEGLHINQKDIDDSFVVIGNKKII